MTRSGAPRLAALDLLRGATVAAMIVVNNPGNWNEVYPPLTHAPWNGLTAADLIFPLFIYIMGVAIGLSPAKEARGRPQDLRRVLARGAWLVALGLLLNLAAAWQAPLDARVPGVLQRIGLTYIATMLIVRGAGPRGQWLWMLGLLAGQSALLVAGGPLAPGLDTGATIDHAVFGSHLLTQAGDPEGLIGWPTSIVTALLGAASARLAQNPATPGPAGRLVAAGTAAVSAGLLLAQVLPLNKALWTASFTLVTAGVAACCLAACLAVSAPSSHRIAAPFHWLGTNPLAIYVLSEFVTILLQQPFLTTHGQAVAPKDLVFWNLLVRLIGDSGGPASSLAYALAYTTLWTVVAGVLFRRGVRLRV